MLQEIFTKYLKEEILLSSYICGYAIILLPYYTKPLNLEGMH